MSTTQLRGSQILDGTITSSDIDDVLEKDFTKVRVTTDDSSSGFLSSKLAPGSGISLDVVGAPGSNQTLRITATGGGTGGGSSLTISGSLGAASYSAVPSTVIFDDIAGFQVSDVGGGTAKITLASQPADELSSSFFGALFGDSSDGNVTITGLTTLTREMHYSNLTITNGGELKPNGNRIFVAGTLIIDGGGSINDDGFSATNHVGRTGFVARNYLGGQGTNGGSGWSLNATNVANGNNASNNTNCSLNASNVAPTGGKGGDSTSRTGGTGGAATQNAVPQKWAGRILEGRGTFGAFNGGSGGGGGSVSVSVHTSGTFVSGGGGSGGGIVWIAAKTIINNGRISAKGGSGASASLGVGSGGCAGGGGASGGKVGIITQSPSIGGTVDITGGSGGLGVATAGHIGQNGSPGAAGSYTLLVVK